MQQECKAILDSTLVKDKSGALFCAAAIKVLLKLQKTPLVDPMLLTHSSQTFRNFISERFETNPQKILQMYNCSWMHHELCLHFMSFPKFQNTTHFFRQYLHDLVVHAPPHYEVVCLRSTNVESQEKFFSQAKHISLRAINWKPENVLPIILLSLQARQKNSEAQQSGDNCLICRQKPTQARPFQSLLFKRGHTHMQRISPFLVCGENVWWTQTEDKSGYKFFDSDHDEDNRPAGPTLLHFSTHTIPDVFEQHSHGKPLFKMTASCYQLLSSGSMIMMAI